MRDSRPVTEIFEQLGFVKLDKWKYEIPEDHSPIQSFRKAYQQLILIGYTYEVGKYRFTHSNYPHIYLKPEPSIVFELSL